jgi:hypothetical protein
MVTMKNKKKRNRKKNKTVKKGGGWWKKKKDSSKVTIRPRNGNNFELKCSVCHNNEFFVKQSMLRGGRLGSFFSTEWIFDKYSRIAICDKCSHIMWFKDKGALGIK